MRKIIFLGLGIAALTFFSCKEKTSSLGSSSSTLVSSEALNPRKLDTLGSRYHTLGRFSGSILVAEEGEIVYHNFFGKADYESGKPFTESTVFSLGSFSELIKNDAGQHLQVEGKTDSLEVVSNQAVMALIEELDLQNTFLQQEAPVNTATGHIHNIGPEGLETTPVSQAQELQLWTNATDLQKLITAIADENLVQDGYSQAGGFNYAIRKNGNLIVIVLGNRRHPVAGEMAENIENLWKRMPYQLPLPRKEINISPALLNQYAGTYELGPKTDLRVILQDDSLFVLMGPQKIYLKPQSENQFFLGHADSGIRFKRDSLNKVGTAELLDGFLTGNEIPKKQ